MKKLILLFLTSVAAFAELYVGDWTFEPGSNPESVTVSGDATLLTPGVYQAAKMTLSGDLILSQPGSYTLQTSSGSITLVGAIIGPASGAATVRILPRTSFTFVGNVASNVTLSREAAPVAPTSPINAPVVNLSTRITLPAGGMLTTGFVVGGTEPRRALIRAIGPTLAQWVPNPMANPRVTVFSGQSQIAANDDWSELATIFSAVGAFALPEGSKDAAILVSLSPGNYTAQVTGDGAGEVIVEVYLVD